MAKYRKIDVRIWNDRKVASLSDAAQLAFLYVLTHPTMTSLGAMRGSPEGLAGEKYGWGSLSKGCREGFRKAFDELFEKGLLKYDESGLLYAPNFLKYNPPESPNVIKSWINALDTLPECELLSLVLQTSKTLISSMSKSFQEAYAEAFREALMEDFGKSMPNQEQEQEQEHIKKNIKKKSSQADKPESVSDNTWNDFIALRNSKRAPLTTTALRTIEKEAGKARMSLEDVLAMCCARGWQGFKHEWVEQEPSSGTTIRALTSDTISDKQAVFFASRLVHDASFCSRFAKGFSDYSVFTTRVAANLRNERWFSEYKPFLEKLKLI